jgi:hypothetical protein
VSCKYPRREGRGGFRGAGFEDWRVQRDDVHDAEAAQPGHRGYLVDTGHNVPGHSMVEVAQDAWARGFSVTVVNAVEKKAEMYEWNERPLIGTNPDHIDIIKHYANQGPDYRVGLFLMNPNNPKFGGYPAFAPFVWDVDMPGEIARMKKETGKTLPHTLVVQTRPQTAKHKRHIVLLHTPETIEQVTLNSYIEDFAITTKTDPYFRKVHPHKSDLKGIGGAAYVVAFGSPRIDDGVVDYYTIEHDFRPAPCPPWLLEWFLADLKRAQQERAKEAAEAKRLREERKAKLKNGDLGTDKYAIMYGVSSHLAGLGFDRDKIEIATTWQVEKQCGTAVANDPKTQAHLRRFVKKLRLGELSCSSTKMVRNPEKPLAWVERKHRKLVLVEMMVELPDDVSFEEMVKQVKTVWPDYKEDNATHRSQVSKAAKRAGFTAYRTLKMWKRGEE